MDEKSGSAEQMPATIGRYQVQESIGYGAMGAVYKAFDPLIKRTLAIKTIRLDIPRQSPQYKSFIERFYHEARISGTLSHPNIVTLFDIGEEGGLPFLAMELVEGETIASMIEKGVRFNPEKVIGLVSQIASAVDYAHTRGVIHRDIKPSNLIFFDADRVKVTDFGIAKLVDAEMTQSGTLLGTPSYMSPEQAMGDKLDGRSDIFSLGVCAFEMLSGDQPFPGNNVTSILYKLVHVDPIEPANLEMNGLVPQKWHDVFGRVLAKKPDDRYQTATEFVQDLEYCLGSWFGAAMGEETLSEANQSALSSVAKSKSAPPVTAAPPPAPPPSAQPPRAPSSAPSVAAAPPPSPAPLHANEVTAAIPAPAFVATPGASPPAARATRPPMPAPSAPPPAVSFEEDLDLPATVHMKAPEGAGVQPDKGKLPPAAPTAKAAPAKGETSAPAETTVLMSADQLPPSRPAPKPKASAPPVPPPPAPQPVAEATVLMGTMEATTRAPVPEMTVKSPVLPPTPPTVKEAVQQDLASPKTVTQPTPKPAFSVPRVAAPAPQPARGAHAGLIVGGAAAVFLLALGLAGIAIYKSRGVPKAPQPIPIPVVQATATPPPATPPPPVAVEGSLHVESQPAGAAVTVNGEAKGQAPLDLAGLVQGNYEVKLDLKGYDSKVEIVTLTSEAPRAELKVGLTRTPPAMSQADILSTPFGASISIDGARVGQTPLTAYKVRVGTRRVEMTKEGHEPWSGTLVVEAGKRAKLDVPLRAIPRATPTPPPKLEVDTSRVYLNTAADVDTMAKKVSGRSASYPENAPKLKSGDAVSVQVSFVVSDAGDVTDLQIVESGGKVLDEAVQAAIRGWKYSPAVKRGVNVKVKITFKQTFRAG